MQERDHTEYIEIMVDISNILHGKVVFLCIGNLDRRDDGAGVYFAYLMQGKTQYEVINTGMVPENWTGYVTRLEPDTIIIVDAVQFDGKPGDIKIFSGDDLCAGNISTHDVSPKLLIEYLRESTKADIYILGIKPKSNEIGEGLSEEVEKAVTNLKEKILTI